MSLPSGLVPCEAYCDANRLESLQICVRRRGEFGEGLVSRNRHGRPKKSDCFSAFRACASVTRYVQCMKAFDVQLRLSEEQPLKRLTVWSGGTKYLIDLRLAGGVHEHTYKRCVC